MLFPFPVGPLRCAILCTSPILLLLFVSSLNGRSARNLVVALPVLVRRLEKTAVMIRLSREKHCSTNGMSKIPTQGIWLSDPAWQRAGLVDRQAQDLLDSWAIVEESKIVVGQLRGCDFVPLAGNSRRRT